MQPVWLFILLGRKFEDAFKKAQRRKVEQMQPMWLCLCDLVVIFATNASGAMLLPNLVQVKEPKSDLKKWFFLSLSLSCCILPWRRFMRFLGPYCGCRGSLFNTNVGSNLKDRRSLFGFQSSSSSSSSDSFTTYEKWYIWTNSHVI